jgi:microcystin-dependent protein
MNQYLGEIRIFGGNFAPLGWQFCDGRLLPISENDALFSLIGTTYGGDGESDFGLPNLQGRFPIHRRVPPSPGTIYLLGETGGVDSVTLTANMIPVHTHALTAAEVTPRCSSASGDSRSPVGRAFAVDPAGVTAFYSTAAPDADMGGLSGTATVGQVGGGQPHTNMPPYLCVSFIIATVGIYPNS